MSTCDSYRLASRAHRATDTIVPIGELEIGGDRPPLLMAGPCAVESEEQIHAIAARVAAAGVPVLRGGAFKPRSSPYSFQGLGAQGLAWLAAAAKAHGLKVVTELMDFDDLDAVSAHCDVIQIGSRNMMNYALLKRLAPLDRTILLKRGMYARIDELLMAAEYLLAGGTRHVILCERGIRTFDDASRNTLDVAAVPILRRLSHLPVIVDPSHASGRRDIVPALARAAIAAGAHGLLIELAERPDRCLCDGEQALHPDEFEAVVDQVRRLSGCMREVGL